ncbi:sigma-70 family RNA polymerase sigma factor [Streptomyces anulatus]|uniref:sigma-70 family RNA polymerase sigma factor n=1 Tax=Streptomyces anulatus TaxID=1892 RepID=UPI002F91982C
MSSEGVKSQLKGVRRALGLSGTTRRVLVHSLLERGFVAPPACERPAPGFTADDLTLLSALARHPRYNCIAEAAGVPAENLRAEISALVAKAVADNAIHLVSLAHRWQLLGTGAPASDEHHGAGAQPPGGSP